MSKRELGEIIGNIFARMLTEQELQLILASTFEHLPNENKAQGETFMRVEYLRLACWRGLLGDLEVFDSDKTVEELNLATQQVIADLRKAVAQ